MRATLDQLIVTLDDLNAFADSIGPVNLALADREEVPIRRYMTIRRRLDYAAFIVALYAGFESFVEDLVWSYSELVAEVRRYNELPRLLREKHLRDSADLVLNRRLGEGRYAKVSEADVIANLHACLSNSTPYQLNRHAIVRHDTNLRAHVVQGLFTALGVPTINDLVRKSSAVVIWFAKLNELGEVPREIPLPSIEFKLDDLVQRRNEVSHNGVVAETLDAAGMGARLDFIRAYARGLFDVVAGSYLHDRYVATPSRSVALGEFRAGPFKEGRVVVVAKPTTPLTIGDAVFGVNRGRVDSWGTIKGLQVDGKNVEAIDQATETDEIGVRVDFDLSRKTQLHVLEAKDERVWA